MYNMFLNKEDDDGQLKVDISSLTVYDISV